MNVGRTIEVELGTASDASDATLETEEEASFRTDCASALTPLKRAAAEMAAVLEKRIVIAQDQS